MTELTDSGYSRSDVGVKVRLINHQTVIGTINIVGYQRLSDWLQKDPEPYMIICDAQIEGEVSRGTMFLNKQHVLWIEPDIEK